jgi:predicted amidohydrolase
MPIDRVRRQTSAGETLVAGETMHTFRVALLQAPPGPPEPDQNVTRGVELCREAKALGADVALFPEMWSVGYHSITELENWESLAVAVDGEFVGRFRELACRLQMGIAITYLGVGASEPQNSMTLFDRHGDEAFTYAKVHLCRWDQPEGSLSAGDSFPVAALDTERGPVQVGAMICFDREFPETARILMLNGAEIILTPNACRLDVHRLAQFRTRAYENMVGVAMANYAPSPRREENGHSVAFSPVAYDEAGRTLDTLIVESGATEAVLLAEFDMDRIRRYREREVWGNAMRRPDVYGPLTAREIAYPFIRPESPLSTA